MILPGFSNRFFVSDRVYDVHTWTGVSQAVAFAFKDVLVAYGMQVGEAAGEFYFFAVYGDGAVGCKGLLIC